jgi:hypothetical protein
MTSQSRRPLTEQQPPVGSRATATIKTTRRARPGSRVTKTGMTKAATILRRRPTEGGLPEGAVSASTVRYRVNIPAEGSYAPDEYSEASGANGVHARGQSENSGQLAAGGLIFQLFRGGSWRAASVAGLSSRGTKARSRDGVRRRGGSREGPGDPERTSPLL